MLILLLLKEFIKIYKSIEQADFRRILIFRIFAFSVNQNCLSDKDTYQWRNRHTEIQTGRDVDNKKCRHAEIQTGTDADLQSGRQTVIQTGQGREVERQRYRHTDRQTDRDTDRNTDTKLDIPTERGRCTLREVCIS